MNHAQQIRSLRRAGQAEEARRLAVDLVLANPNDAELQYEAACVHDLLGLETAAVPYYQAAIAGDLEPTLLRGAYLGLGSTWRALGRYAEAEETLTEGLARFPDARELQTFLAMVLHNRGRSKQAVELLLTLLARTTADENIAAYRRAIEFYAKDIDRAWAE